MRYGCQLLRAGVVAFLLWLSVRPVEVRWADADVMLGAGIPVAGVIGVLCVLLKKGEARVTVVDGLAMVWAAYYVGRVWLGAEYPCGMDFLKAVEMLLLYFVLRAVMCDGRLSAWWLVAGIAVCGAYEALLGVCQMLAGAGRHHLFVLTGTFQNPGPYSAYLMMAAVMGLRASLCGEGVLRGGGGCGGLSPGVARGVRYVCHAMVLLPLLVLPATWSRAAFAGLAVCALWICRRKYWKYRFLVWGGLAALAVALYFMKRGSADGRALVWMASLTSWAHDMWLGVGVGGFRHACAEGIAEMWGANPDSGMFASAGVADYAYNALLKVLVEQGLTGASLCVATVGFAMVRLFRRSMALFMGMLSLLVFSMFSYPFELLPYTIVGVLVAAWSESGEDNTPRNLLVSKTMCIFALVIMAATGWFVKGEVERRFQYDKDASLFAGTHDAAFLTDYHELLPWETDNPQYLFDFAKTLRSERRYRDSNAVLRRGALVSADPMFYIIMGNNYRDGQFYDLAEEAYRKAYAIMPNRLYPLYQLMMMYAGMGEREKACGMAEVVRKSYVKIESGATRQMREKADSIMTPYVKPMR